MIWRWRLRWLVPAAFLALVAFGAVWIVRARQALQQAEAEQSGSSIPFQIRPISSSQSAATEFLPAPPDFLDAQLFHDSVYIAGAGGVWVYDLTGNLQTSYLAGRDLPPSPPVAMAVGTVSGDSEARLWIATAAAGILAFDGGRFSQIRLESHAYGNMTSLLILPSGILLAGFSEGGVIAYNGATMAPFHRTLRNIPVTALAGTEGDLWIGTRDRGVIHWSAGSSEEFQTEDGLPDNGILAIAVMGPRVFAGTAVGVAEFRDGKHSRNIAEGVFSRALLAVKDRLLIGTVDEGIIEAGLEAAGRFTPISDLEPRNIRRLVEIRGIPFALTSSGLFERQSDSGLWNRRIAAPKGSWTDRNISALSVDSSGKLWIGYFDRGIDIVDIGRSAVHVEDDQVFCVNRIVPDHDRNMQLVATANGLVFFNLQGAAVRRMARTDGLISEHVVDVISHGGGLALATAAGITLIDARGPQSIYAFHGLVNNHVYALGMNGPRLLAGTLGGLSVIEDGFVRSSYTTANSQLKQNWVSAIVPVHDGWFIGTYGAGVIHLDADGRWTEFPDLPPKTVVNPNAMLAVSNRIFAGTLESGLLVYDAAGHNWTPVNAGIPSLNVTALAAAAGQLFVGTDNGIVRMPVEGFR